MKKIIHRAIRHPLISGSTIIVAGSLLANIINYLSNLAVARILTSSDYGIFASLMSIFNIFTVFSLTIITVFAKFSSVFIGQKKKELIGPLILKGSIWVGIIAFVISGLIIVFSSRLSSFLNINDTTLIMITSIALFFSFLASVPTGILQGLLKFLYLSFANVFSSSIKLIAVIILLSWGLRVFGAINAFLISAIVAYIFYLLPLYKYFKKGKDSNFAISNLYRKLSLYALPVFLSSIGMTAIMSVDIILVKHFFEPVAAGHYSALSLMGRSIFYVVSPVTLVLFPLVALKKERKEKLSGTVLLSVFLMGMPTLILSMIYFFFPKLIINIFFPQKEYIILSPYLGPFSIFVFFYVLCFLFNNFYLSIGKVKVLFLTIGAAILEILFIIFFHKDIPQIIIGLIVSSFLLLISLLLYYHHATKTS